MKLVDSAVKTFKTINSDEKVKEVINLPKDKEKFWKNLVRKKNCSIVNILRKVGRGGGDKF